MPTYKKRTEAYEQAAVAMWLNINHPKVLWTASAGGMRTSIGTAKKMKAMGYKKGCPDIMIFERRSGFCGLFIELKVKGGTRQPEQIDFIQELSRRGYFAVFAYGYDEAVEVIEQYLAK